MAAAAQAQKKGTDSETLNPTRSVREDRLPSSAIGKSSYSTPFNLACRAHSQSPLDSDRVSVLCIGTARTRTMLYGKQRTVCIMGVVPAFGCDWGWG